jgi:hypothetical protein
MSNSCGWQGFGFNASYEDAGCVEGYASDLDNCEVGENGAFIAIGDEDCPQCSGIGKELGFNKLGVMALHRQREYSNLLEFADLLPEDAQEEMRNEVDGIFRLILKLEGASNDISAIDTPCWHCNKPYVNTELSCPHCCATNPNHDLESATIESQDNSHIDHNFESVDDSFDHAYGTEQIHYQRCLRCGKTEKASDADFDEC